MSKWVLTTGEAHEPEVFDDWHEAWQALVIDLDERRIDARHEGRAESIVDELKEAQATAEDDSVIDKPFTVTADGVTFTIEEAP